MKKILIILTATLFITMTAKGQNLFFFGENSYPCTETFSLQTKIPNFFDYKSLNVLFAKDGTTALFVVIIKTQGELISGKLIIYLDDGTVITCTDRGKYEYVDYIASTVYYLTNEQLSKMKNSNINTVRFALKCDDCPIISPEVGNFTASNKGSSTKTDVPALITELFD